MINYGYLHYVLKCLKSKQFNVISKVSLNRVKRMVYVGYETTTSEYDTDEKLLWSEDEPETMLEIVTRDSWGARPAPIEKRLKKPAMQVVYSLTYTSTCTKLKRCCKALKWMQNQRMNIYKKTDVDYNFMIGHDGLVYEGRGWGVVPSLPKEYKKYNRSAIYIGFIAPSDDFLNLHMHDAKFDLLYYGLKRGHIDRDYLHYDIRKDWLNFDAPPDLS